jgi:hypothetical protein
MQCLLNPSLALLNWVYIRTYKGVRHKYNTVLRTPFSIVVASRLVAISRVAIFYK